MEMLRYENMAARDSDTINRKVGDMCYLEDDVEVYSYGMEGWLIVETTSISSWIEEGEQLVDLNEVGGLGRRITKTHSEDRPDYNFFWFILKGGGIVEYTYDTKEEMDEKYEKYKKMLTK